MDITCACSQGSADFYGEDFAKGYLGKYRMSSYAAPPLSPDVHLDLSSAIITNKPSQKLITPIH
jgi:hypothetical protein